MRLMVIRPAAMLVIRPAFAVRAYIVAFGMVWLGLVGSMMVATVVQGPSVASLIPAGMFAFGSVIIASNLRMRVVGDLNELRVVNGLSEQRYPRSAIQAFVEHQMGGVPSRFGGGVAMLLNDGRLIDLRATFGAPSADQIAIATARRCNSGSVDRRPQPPNRSARRTAVLRAAGCRVLGLGRSRSPSEAPSR
jgi:hypothetical protein